MDAERWQRVSPLLDAMFELSDEERERSLELLRDEDPQLAADLAELMALESEREDFLSEPLIAPLPGAHPGTIVGPWRLERMLGEGGMGQVWLGGRADGLYQRRVAIKLLRPGLVEPNLRLRFTRERDILARLAHPNIARLLDAGMGRDGQPYLTLEYIEGEPITDWCRARLTPLSQRLKLFAQVCAAVSHAHANLIVHRDLKPSNIMVTPAGEVRLLDFGIAKLLDHEGPPPEHTRTGMRAFTLHYAAPEQIRGEPVTTMTDVYALGVVLYELLTGVRPYRLPRESDGAWEEAILHQDPQRPSQALSRSAEAGRLPVQDQRRHARMLSGDLDNIVLKALGKTPERRYPSVEAMSLDLARYADGRPVQARPQGVAYRLGKFVRRHRWPLATTAFGLVVVAAAVLVVAGQAARALEDAARAQAMQDFIIGLFEQAGGAAPGEGLDLRRLLEAGVDRGNRELRQQPRARAELLGLVARLRIGLGDYADASMMLDRQALIIDSLPRVPPGLRLESVTLRGQSQRLMSRPGQCTVTMQPWLDEAQRLQAQLASQAAEFYSQLGRCRQALGERNVARQLFERSLAARDASGDTAGAVQNLSDLATLRLDAGEPRAALDGYTNALLRLRRGAGAGHPQEIELLSGIAASRRALGEFPAAEAAQAQAVLLALDLHGTQHPLTLRQRRALAAIQREAGRPEDALAELRDAHRLLVDRFGPGHVEVAASHQAIALAEQASGRLGAALATQAEAVEIWRDSRQARLLAEGLYVQARMLHAAGDDTAAARALDEVRVLLAEMSGASAPSPAQLARLAEEITGAAQDPAGR
ncbi:hypothetical protein GCM10028862_21920 [Luteimonas pelagia]